MPSPTNSIPKYRKHSSGQARVTINGRDYLLGPHGSKASIREYDRLIPSILLRFNPENWTTTVEGNQIRIDFAEPEEVTVRKAEGRVEAERNLRIVSFHIKCRQLHEARKALQGETLSGLSKKWSCWRNYVLAEISPGVG